MGLVTASRDGNPEKMPGPQSRVNNTHNNNNVVHLERRTVEHPPGRDPIGALRTLYYYSANLFVMFL